MEHTPPTDTDTAALLAEVEALLVESAAIDARTDALLAGGSAAVRLADLALQLEIGRRDLDAQERYQRRISRAVGVG